MVRAKGPRRRAAEHGVHHRRLHLDEVTLVEEPAQMVHDLRALAEHLEDLGVGHQIQVALAIADLRVLQAVPLLGQRASRLGEDVHALCDHAVFTSLCLGQQARGSFDPDEVAALGELPQAKVLLAHHIQLDPDLDFARAVANLGEGRLAETADRDDATGDRDAAVFACALGRMRAIRPASEPLVNRARRRRRAETVCVGVLTRRADLADLALPFGDQLAFVSHRLRPIHGLSTGGPHESI